eukprot:TRINITY_DN5275_c0_g1_i2.p1 TRINITY_DN5275_c0_g1~~TRINITY_DN5275_c0_g1_i2.p1  ORF type:complete len:138 (+),score=28.18 TRINITY_DN5275_c0_g1_i2:75-488(+)
MSLVKYLEFNASVFIPGTAELFGDNTILLPETMKDELEDTLGEINSYNRIFVRQMGSPFEDSYMFRFVYWQRDENNVPGTRIVLLPVDLDIDIKGSDYVTVRVCEYIEPDEKYNEILAEAIKTQFIKLNTPKEDKDT